MEKNTKIQDRQKKTKKTKKKYKYMKKTKSSFPSEESSKHFESKTMIKKIQVSMCLWGEMDHFFTKSAVNENN